MLYLHSIGHFHPEPVIDNKFLENLDIGVDEEWIVQRVGIRERRTVLNLDYIRSTRNADVRGAREASVYTNAQTGCRAAQMALTRAKLQPSDIGMVIAGGSTPQYLTPADASIVANELGIEALSFDINSACTSFALPLWLLSCMDLSNGPDFVLLVNPENMTRSIDYSDRRTAVLFGDASTAVIVSTRVPSPVSVTCAEAPGSSPAQWAKIQLPVSGHFFHDGAAVQAFAIRTMTALLNGMRKAGEPQDRMHFIGHQANKLALDSTRKRLDIPESRHLWNVDQFGNCSSAGAPSVLSQNWERFTTGDSVLMATVGAGLTWAGLRFDFNAA